MRDASMTAPAAEFKLHLFGSVRLVRRGTSRPVPLSPQQRLFLGVLGASGEEGVPVRRMLDLLWPSGGERTLANRLAQLKHATRLRVGRPGIVLDVGDRLALGRDLVECDLDRFRRALAGGDLEACVTLLGRGFFPDGVDGGSPALTAWVGSVAIDAVDATRMHLAEMADAATAAADWSEQARCAALRLLLDPDDEEGLRARLRALALLGRVAEGAAEFTGYLERRRLADPAWEPEEETRSLADRMNSGSLRRSLVLDDRTVEETTPPPIVGNLDLLGELREIVWRPPPPEPRLVVVSGPVGAGKSFLSSALLREASVQGWRVLRARGGTLQRESEGGIAHQWVTAIADDGDATRVRIVEPDGVPYDGVERNAWPPVVSAITTLLVDALRREHGDAGTILFVDDAHHADACTLGVIDLLMRTPNNLPILILLCAAPGIERWPTIHRWSTELSLSHFLSIDPLASTEGKELVERILPERLHHLASDLVSLSGGNPGLLTVLAATVRDGEVRSLAGLDFASPRLTDFLKACLRDGPKEVDAIVTVLGTTEEGWTADTISLILECDLEVVHAGLEFLVRHRIADRSRASYALRIPAYRVLLRDAADPRLLRIARACAHHLTDSGYPHSVVAHAWDIAGDRNQVLRFAWMAAEEAEGTGAVQTRIDQLELGLRWTAKTGDGDRWRTALAAAYLDARLPRKAIPLLQSAASASLAHGNYADWLTNRMRLIDAEGRSPGANASIIAHRLDAAYRSCLRHRRVDAAAEALDRMLHYHHRAGSEREVRGTLDTALSLLDDAPFPETRARISMTLALNTYYGEVDTGILHARQAVALADDLGDPSLQLSALNRLFVVLVARGMLNSAEGRAVVTRAFALARNASDLMEQLHPTINLAVWYTDCGDFDAAIELLTPLLSMVRDAPDHRLRVIVQSNLALALLRADQCDDAEPLLREWYRNLQGWRSLEAVAHCEAALGWVALEKGKLGEASEFAGQLSAHPLPSAVDVTTLAIFQAKLARRRNDMAGAERILNGAIARTRSRFPVHFAALVAERMTCLRGSSLRPEWDADLGEALRVAKELDLGSWEGRLRPFTTMSRAG